MSRILICAWTTTKEKEVDGYVAFDLFIKNLSKTLKYQKEQTAKIKHKSLHAPFWELNTGTKMPGLRKETMKMYNFAYKCAKELGCDSIAPYYEPDENYGFWVQKDAKIYYKIDADDVTYGKEDENDVVSFLCENL